MLVQGLQPLYFFTPHFFLAGHTGLFDWWLSLGWWTSRGFYFGYWSTHCCNSARSQRYNPHWETQIKVIWIFVPKFAFYTIASEASSILNIWIFARKMAKIKWFSNVFSGIILMTLRMLSRNALKITIPKPSLWPKSSTLRWSTPKGRLMTSLLTFKKWWTLCKKMPKKSKHCNRKYIKCHWNTLVLHMSLHNTNQTGISLSLVCWWLSTIYLGLLWA